VEETDAGHAGGSGLQTRRRIVQSYPAQRIHRDASGNDAGLAEPIQAGPGSHRLARDNLLEYGTEEDGVNPAIAGASQLVERMAGDRDDRCLASDGSEETADLGSGQSVTSGA
jgi:hypothetical protein